MKNSAFLLSGVSALSLAYAASAETMNPTVQSIVSAMTTGGGSETLQWQIAPNYSDLFGLGVRGTVGGYINEDFALGVIIDYAEHREEYLANAGVRLNDNMRMIGSVGILKESEEFTLGDGREDVSQLEYGLSLKGNYEAGIVRGFEINAYHTNASSDTDAVETGDLTGIQVVTQLKPAAATDIRLGAGYEKAEWDGGDVDEGLTLQALGSHKLSDTLSMNFEAKSAETENVYGLGFTYDLSSPEVRNSTLSVDLMQIQGKHGISDDTRVALNWTVGFGGTGGAGGSDVTASSMGSMARADLLADVMTRPAFLPERVLARDDSDACYRVTSGVYGFSDDIAQKIRDEFGNQARFADWNEFSRFAGSAEGLDLFLNNAGLLDGMEAWVTRDGVELAAWDVRYHVFNSAGSVPPDWYIVLDQLQSYELTLGRWNEPKRAFAYICD